MRIWTKYGIMTFMSDVNEELVRRYFELQGFFVRTNAWYRYQTPAGVGWSDIDLMLLHPDGRAAIVEAKGWHTTMITKSFIKHAPSLFYFVRPESLAKAEEVLGVSTFKRILAVGRVAASARAALCEYATERSVEVLEFPTVLRYLIDQTPTNIDAGSKSEHVIRVPKVYGFLGRST